MTKLFKNGQKRGPLKRSDIFRNLIVAFTISLFILQQETLRVVTIALIYFTLALHRKFEYFRRFIYNPVKHL